MGRKAARIPSDSLIGLRGRLALMPIRSAARAAEVARAAELYGVSVSNVYRQLRDLHRPKGLRRGDHGAPRALSAADVERYCEVIAAMKIRTENGKGRKLSTVRAIELLEEHGVDTPDGRVGQSGGKSLLGGGPRITD